MISTISEQTLDFLDRHNRDMGIDLTRVPSSSSQLFLGDVITFNYFGEGYNGASRIALVVSPVVRSAETGNRLLTVVNVSPSMTLNSKVINELYKNRASLGSEEYRTFILNNKVKNILRIEPLSRMLEERYEAIEEDLS